MPTAKFLPAKTIADGTDTLKQSGGGLAPLPQLPGDASGTPFWETNPEAYDTIWIGSQEFANTPVTISGEGPSFKLDSAPAPGTDGARQAPQGYIPAKVTIAFHCYTEEHLRALEALLGEIRPKPGKTVQNPDGIAIIHPTLKLFGLYRFRIPKLPFWKALRGGVDGFEVTLHCVEWFAGPKAAGTKVVENAHPTIFDGQNKPQVIKPSITAPSRTGPVGEKFVRGKRQSG